MNKEYYGSDTRKLNKDMAVTKEEFDAYVRVQRSGVTNMFNVNRVSELSGLGRPKIVEIMEKYDIYTDKYNKNEQEI